MVKHTHLPLTILLRLREADHVLGQDLGHAPDARRDDVEPGAGGLEDGDAEGLGEGGVEEDVAAAEVLEVEEF